MRDCNCSKVLDVASGLVLHELNKIVENQESCYTPQSSKSLAKLLESNRIEVWRVERV
jgi:hypothetical protein